MTTWLQPRLFGFFSATLPPLVYGHQFAKKRVQLSGQQDPLTLGIQMMAILALMN